MANPFLFGDPMQPPQGMADNPFLANSAMPAAAPMAAANPFMAEAQPQQMNYYQQQPPAQAANPFASFATPAAAPAASPFGSSPFGQPSSGIYEAIHSMEI